MDDPPLQVSLVPPQGAETRQTWWFTFGVGQPNAGRFFVVRDATWSEARTSVVKLFGRRWAFQYDEDGWFRDGVSQEERYGLVELT